MLKITKGLKPFVEGDITPYTDDKGDVCVRVKMWDEDFCIAAQDYVKEGKVGFIWDEAMKALEDDGLTTFTKRQAELCSAHQDKINDVLNEIGGDEFKDEQYWTSSESAMGWAWIIQGHHNTRKGDPSLLNACDAHYKDDTCRVRPIINL